MDALITYDVRNKNSEVKAAMRELGYLDRWKSDEKFYYLPNSTLWKNDVTTVEALAAIKGVTNMLGVKLERAIAVAASPWNGIEGEPHAS